MAFRSKITVSLMPGPLRTFVAKAASSNYEDFTTYTKAGANQSRLTVTAPKVVAAALRRDDEAQVSYDFGASYFAQDFSHEFEFYVNSSGDTNAWVGALWGLTNTIDGRKPIRDASGEELCVTAAVSGASVSLILVEEHGGAAPATDTDNSTLSLDTLYYGTFSRDEAVGANGTAYFKVYSEAARTNLLLTLTRTLSAKIDFQYGMAMQAFETASDAKAFDGYIQNLELVSNGVAAGGAFTEHYYRRLLAGAGAI